MKNFFDKILATKFWWVFLLLVLVIINFAASSFHSRFDLTKEKRYTLSNATKRLLTNLDDNVTIEVFLKGDFPAGFKKLANSVDEFLQNCKEYSGPHLRIQFVDPFKIAGDSAEKFLNETYFEIKTDSLRILQDTSNSFQSQLKLGILRSRDDKATLEKNVIETYTSYFIDSLSYLYNISRFTLQAPSKVGDEQTVKDVFPGAVIQYKEKTIGVDLLKGTKSYGTDPEQLAELYNDVEATLEYKFASAIEKITSKTKPLIGYALGNGEGWGYNVNDAVKTIIRNYQFDTINIKTAPYIPSDFNAIVILKPTQAFNDDEKLKIDQYVMRGGKLFWMIDNMYTEFDSLYKSGGFVAFDRGLNLDDILFRYGVRINQNLLQDMQCDKLPQLSGKQGDMQQQRLVDWPYFPILNGTDHPISKDLDGVRTFFPSTIDTIKSDGIKKTFLLQSSANSRILSTPAIINFEFMQIAPDIKLFTSHDVPVAVLLEGKFTSLFKNRISKIQIDSLNALGFPFKDTSDHGSQMIVVADGDVAMNQFSQTDGPLPMGMNLYTHYTFANKEFYINALEYLVNPSGILETRAKNYVLRLLDAKKIKEQKSNWQLINIALPVLLVILLGIIYRQTRKKQYE